MTTTFKVLGPLEVRHGGERVDVPAGLARVLLATLLLRANQTVTMDALVERLWDGRAVNPARTRSTLHMVVTRLRQALGEANVVRTATNGYLAEVGPDALDLHRFRVLAEEGRFAEALSLWRGEPLSDVRSDALHQEDVEPLREERLVVLERRIEADLAAGRAVELVPELRGLTKAYPLRERFWGQLVLALHRGDRQAEALAEYRAISERLVEELGVDPSQYLRAVHHTVLVGEPEDVPAPEPSSTAWTALCQLPPDTVDFVGREDLCDEATRLLTGGPGGTGVPVVAITGPPGGGKSAWTVRVAHALRDRFPDGQLFVRLDGAGRAPRDPGEVLAELLTAVGVAPSAIPDRLEARAAAFRAQVADRAVLLVLDDAAGVAQVRHLLPGTPGSAVLVSSRRWLAGLPGVRVLRVPPLPTGLALDLLSLMIGADRVAAERRAADALVEACGGLPLALRIVGARLAARPSLPLAKLAARLADERRRLDEMAAGDLEVRASLEPSYEALRPDAALAFRRLGLLGAVDVASWVVKALTGLDDPEPAVEELVEANLLEETGADATGEPRYRLHDVLAVYAAEVAAAADPVGNDAALRTYLGVLTTLAEVASLRTTQSVDEVPFSPAPTTDVLPAREVERLTADGGPWLLAEQVALERAIEAAARRGWAVEALWLYERAMRYLDVFVPNERVVELAEVVERSLRAAGEHRLARRARYHLTTQNLKESLDDEVVGALAECARGFGRDGDHAAEALALASLAHYDHLRTGVADVEVARRAVEASERSGVRSVACSTRRELALMLAHAGRYEEALPHFDETLALCRELGSGLAEVQVHHSVARCALQHGDLERAAEAAARAVERIDLVNDLRGMGYVTSLAGRVAVVTGRPAEGVRLATRAYRIFVEVGEGIGAANAAASIGEGYLALGRPADALAVLEPALREYGEVGTALEVERMRKAFAAATAAVDGAVDGVVRAAVGEAAEGEAGSRSTP
ncbi:AfsR/SARP family transcriptional regulator [Saccharothrix xinjiangensis]|uniref:BTAD domain-containing putative transcriptional regulator n=1 Tax=Saccharothrix xinjiangensis TaxID=204798 RepID=A0ABV9Y869_9PSEU